MIPLRTALTLTCLLTATPAALANPGANLPLGTPNQQVQREVELRLEVNEERRRQREEEVKLPYELEVIVDHVWGFCDGFYGCGTGVRMFDW